MKLINKKNLIIILLGLTIILFTTIVIVKIFKPVKEINKYEKYSDEYLETYLDPAKIIFNEKTYEKITDNEIISLVSYQLLKNDVTDEEIKNFVFKYFGITNYKLKEKTYTTILNDEVIITNQDNNYQAEFITKNIPNSTLKYKSKEIIDDILIVSFDNIKDIDNNSRQKVGILKFYLNLENDNLVIKKIIYDDILEYTDITNQTLKEMNVYLEKIINHFYKENIYYFNDDIIRNFIVKQYLNYGNKLSVKELTKIVSSLFNKTNFKINEGEYDTILGNHYTVKIINNIYSSTLIEGTTHMYKNTISKVLSKNNTYIVVVDCQNVVDLDKGLYKKVGESKIYLTKNNDVFNIEKIVYFPIS